MAESPHKINITTIPGMMDNAFKKDPLAEKYQAASLAGGEGLFALFFEYHSILAAFYRMIATGGDSVWNNDTKGAKFVQIGDNVLYISAYFAKDGKECLENGTSGLNDFKHFGYANLVLILNSSKPDREVYQVASYQLDYAGAGVPDNVAGEDLKELIENITDVIKSFLENLFEAILDTAVSASAVGNVVASKVGEAAESSAVKGETIAKTMTTDIEVVVEAVGLVLGLGQLAISLVLFMMEKTITASLRICNLSKKDIEFYVCFIKEDSVLVSPSLPPQEPVYLPGPGPCLTKPEIIGQDPCHYIDLVFSNTDALKGVGYVIKAMPDGDFPGFNAMVNIPNHDDNSIHVTFGKTDACSQYWEQNKGINTGLSASITSGNYRLSLATNQVSGKSPDLESGGMGYNYEHLLLLENLIF